MSGHLWSSAVLWNPVAAVMCRALVVELTILNVDEVLFGVEIYRGFRNRGVSEKEPFWVNKLNENVELNFFWVVVMQVGCSQWKNG